MSGIVCKGLEELNQNKKRENAGNYFIKIAIERVYHNKAYIK